MDNNKNKQSLLGYDFQRCNNGGLGAIIHSVLLAYTYAKHNNLQFCFIKEGYTIPRLNGCTDDGGDSPDHNWHTFFERFSIYPQNECYRSWPLQLSQRQPKQSMNQYSNNLKYMCKFKSTISDMILQLVEKTPFNKDTDIVIHIRRTDKTFDLSKTLNNSFLKHNIESDPIILDTYVFMCKIYLKQYNLKRVYICTDDQSICTYIQDRLVGTAIVIWDTTESKKPLQAMRIINRLPRKIAQEETLNAFKNLFIMRDAKVLIGGRMSYFFRIAELLRYPLLTINLKDNKVFGCAPYVEQQQYYSNFINFDVNFQQFKDMYFKNKIVSIPNFISKSLLEEIKPLVHEYKWFTYTIMPNGNDWTLGPILNIPSDSPDLHTHFSECTRHKTNNQFTYRFQRQYGPHVPTCSCVSCKLYKTISHSTTLRILEALTGEKNLLPGEMFLSKYTKGDFLTTHHDKDKGRIAVTYSLTYDWDPNYGGILHFVDSDNNVTHSISPTLGSMTIFQLEKHVHRDHFVSEITVNNRTRYMITAWYV
jgi:hypothetical protein